MNDWIGKSLEDGLQGYLLGRAEASVWTWLLLANLCLGLFFAAHLATRTDLNVQGKVRWLLLGFLLSPLALLLFGLRRKR